MKRSERLGAILELTETHEQKAARQLGETNRQLQNSQRGLENLRGFLSNYTARFQQTGDQGMDARQLLNYRMFLDKINMAVVQQELAVQKAQQDVVRRRTEWEDAHRRSLGLKTVVDKARSEEGRIEARKLQAEMDERASRRAANPLSAMA